MVSLSFSRLAVFISALIFVGSVASAPTGQNQTQPKPAAAAAPHFVIYSDKFVSGTTPSVDQVKGYNVFALSFWLTSGPADQALGWTQLTAAQRSTAKAAYKNAGISLVVSAFGSTDTPTSAGANPTTTAQKLAAFVSQYGLDGVDVDYEDLNAFNKGDGSAENWLITFTTALRAALPQGAILTHAPLAPWFQPNGRWGGGGYLKVHQSVGSSIDWYNIQFYNQGTTEYTDCNGLLTQSSSAWPKTSLFEIAASGVPQSKLIIGKPATPSDASNGYISPSSLAQCVSQAKGKGWNGGVMVWEFPDAAASWIATVRGSAFPETAVIGGTGGATP